MHRCAAAELGSCKRMTNIALCSSDLRTSDAGSSLEHELQVLLHHLPLLVTFSTIRSVHLVTLLCAGHSVIRSGRPVRCAERCSSHRRPGPGSVCRLNCDHPPVHPNTHIMYVHAGIAVAASTPVHVVTWALPWVWSGWCSGHMSAQPVWA